MTSAFFLSYSFSLNSFSAFWNIFVSLFLADAVQKPVPGPSERISQALIKSTG